MNNTDIFTVVGKYVGTMLRQNSKHTNTLAALPRTVEGTLLLAFQYTCSLSSYDSNDLTINTNNFTLQHTEHQVPL